MAECLWCGYEMPWPGSLCSRICHEKWEAVKAQEQADPLDFDGEVCGEKRCEVCGGPVHWLVSEQEWVHQSGFSPCVLGEQFDGQVTPNEGGGSVEA